VRQPNHLEGQIASGAPFSVLVGPRSLATRAAMSTVLAVALLGTIHAVSPAPAGSAVLAAGCGIATAVAVEHLSRRRSDTSPAVATLAEQTMRDRLAADLVHAVARRELVLHYQPKADLTTGAIAGAEALVRWNHPVLGQLQPEDFIPLAEETGAIAELGAWVLERACRQARAWEPLVGQDFTMAVNLSPRQFQFQPVDEIVLSTLRSTGLPASRLELELTEGHALHQRDDVSRTLQRLVGRGVRCSIDDFGTGYSGLRQLESLPVTGVKIDKSFVREIRTATDRAPIIRAVIALAADLDLDVVAEGVETSDQLEFLRAVGCHQAQGYRLGAPVPAETFEQLLLDEVAPQGPLDPSAEPA
jgi:EAL domain-containing protein (putative c-di-GMP-specific phosphodiesterase class I)